jgi:hypothetical protein
MAEALSFTSAKRRKDPIPFDLDGETYSFTPPKQAAMALPFLDDENAVELRVVMDWLGKGLPEEQVERLIERLRDKEDDFDIDTLKAVVKGLVGKVSGRPTT